jgi:BioD-like phosphotransacetylase family protein
MSVTAGVILKKVAVAVASDKRAQNFILSFGEQEQVQTIEEIQPMQAIGQ